MVRAQAPMKIFVHRRVIHWEAVDGTRYSETIYPGGWGTHCRLCFWPPPNHTTIFRDLDRAIDIGLRHLRRWHQVN